MEKFAHQLKTLKNSRELSIGSQSIDAKVHSKIEQQSGEIGKSEVHVSQTPTPQASNSSGASSPKPSQPSSITQPSQNFLSNAEKLAALKESTSAPLPPKSQTQFQEKLQSLKTSQPQSSMLAPSTKSSIVIPRSSHLK